MLQNSDLPFVLKHGLCLILSGFALYAFVPVGGVLDLTLIQPFIDAHAQFPLRQHWALAILSHQYVKYVLIGVYALLLLGWLASFISPRFRQQRWSMGYFFVLVALSTAVVGLLKSQSAHACPWDMLLTGNQALVWDFSASQGHCFPGGHAATGFALMTGYFVYWRSQRKRAYFFLIASLILGTNDAGRTFLES